MARPLCPAWAPLSRATSVTVEGLLLVASTVGLQPSIVPFSVSKMNTDEPECPCLSLTTNPGAELNTCPVGAAPVTLTTRPALFTDVAVAPVYSVALSEPLSATHNGEPGLAFVPGDAARPHALTRSGSVSGALPGWSETRLIWRYAVVWAPAGAAPSAAAASAPAVTIVATGHRPRRARRDGFMRICVIGILPLLVLGCMTLGSRAPVTDTHPHKATYSGPEWFKNRQSYTSPAKSGRAGHAPARCCATASQGACRDARPSPLPTPRP